MSEKLDKLKAKQEAYYNDAVETGKIEKLIQLTKGKGIYVSHLFGEKYTLKYKGFHLEYKTYIKFAEEWFGHKTPPTLLISKKINGKVRELLKVSEKLYVPGSWDKELLEAYVRAEKKAKKEAEAEKKAAQKEEKKVQKQKAKELSAKLKPED